MHKIDKPVLADESMHAPLVGIHCSDSVHVYNDGMSG